MTLFVFFSGMNAILAGIAVALILATWPLLRLFSFAAQKSAPQEWLGLFYRSYALKFLLTLGLLYGTLSVSRGYEVYVLISLAVTYAVAMYLLDIIL